MRIAALIVFCVILSVWTYLLLIPNPVPPGVNDLLGFWEHAKFVAAKSLHASCYGFLTLVGCAAFGWRRVKWVALAMVAHGAVTEYGQTFVPNRTGTVQDVFIDAAGVTVAYLLVRQFAR